TLLLYSCYNLSTERTVCSSNMGGSRKQTVRMVRKKSRAYRQQIRADAAAATRQRIIDVTRECLMKGPLENVGLPEIARRAGVARSTIYIAFGSREGLMVAVAEDLLRRGGFERIGQALANPDAVAAMEASLREGARFYAEEQAVGRAMFAAAAL